MQHSSAFHPIFIVLAVALTASALPVEEDDRHLFDPVVGVLVQSGVNSNGVKLSPGCYVKTPSNCPKQSSFSAPLYKRDTWGEAHRNAAKDKNACLVTRKNEYDSWCGSADTEMKFVPRPPLRPKPCPSTADICAGKATCQHKCRCPMCKPRCPPVMCTKAMPAPPCKLVKSAEKDRNGCPKHPCGIKVCPTPKPCPSTADICAGKATCQHKCPCPRCLGHTTPPLTSGLKNLNGRTFTVSVPSEKGVYPVLIACHGSGGSGGGTISKFERDGTLSKSFIIVAPDGSKGTGSRRQWDQSVDVTFVGSTLLNHLEMFENVKPEFSIHGHSQGAALTNQILIENSDSRIVKAVTAASQLNAQQYHEGQFWPTGSSSGKSRLKRRPLLQVVGARDTVIPAKGPPERGVAGFMVEWKESAYAYAKAMGYAKEEQTTPTDTTDYLYVDYGAVKAIEGKNWGHDAGSRSGFSPTVVNFLMTGQL